jgi:hypothetical protein
MIRPLLLSLAILGLSPFAVAQSTDCDKSEPACVLDAAWSATLVLPPEKQARLAPAFLEIAVLSGEPDLVDYWEGRLERSADQLPSYPDYGWQKAKPILQAGGVEKLIETARQRADPLSFGRVDALLSAGRHFALIDPDAAARLNDALFSLIETASSFEAPNLAHAAAELAMIRCDGAALSRAIAKTDAPRSLRYAFWRARITGRTISLLDQVRRIDQDEDTRDVRRVLEGYRAIMELGYCVSPNSNIGG